MNVSCLPCTHDLKVIFYNAFSGPGPVYGYVCLYRVVCLYVCMCCVCICMYFLVHVHMCACTYTPACVGQMEMLNVLFNCSTPYFLR